MNGLMLIIVKKEKRIDLFRVTLPIKHKPNTLVSTEQREKNKKVYIVVLTLPAGNRSDWSARICPKRQPTYRMAKDL